MIARARLIVITCLVWVSACGPSATGLPTAPGVRAVVETTFYEAEGLTRRQWLASMRAAAQRAGVHAPYLAHTAWQTRWSYGTSRTTARGCEL